jgi:hypothetical protein
MSEPVFHCFEDELPDGHSLKGQNLYCVDCAELLACNYGEYMQAWLETGLGTMCLDCFATRHITDFNWHNLEITP